MQLFLTRVRDHMTLQLIGGDKFLVACVAFKDFVDLEGKGK